MNKRRLKLDKYGISKYRYKELCGFCEQYPDWVNRLEEMTVSAGRPEISDSPIPTTKNSDKTGNLAIRRAELEEKCELITSTAQEAGGEFWRCILKSVCYGLPVAYMQSFEDLHLSTSAFYERRRYFFYLLDKKKK